MEQNNDQEKMIDQHGAAQPVQAAVPKKDRFLPISILVAAIVIGGAVVFASMYKGGSSAPAQNAGGVQAPVAQAPVVPTAAAVDTLGPRDAILGNPSAPVTIIEYGDYQCPYCGRYFSDIQPTILSNYINTGKAKMVFRDFAFLGPESTAAGEAAECAEDQNKLWAYHDALYSAKVGDVAKGGNEDDGFFNQALFLSLAQKVGLDIPTFTSCIDNNTDGAIVQQEVASATAFGVNSTPVTFVNGVEVTVQGQSAGADPTTVLQAIANAVAAAK